MPRYATVRIAPVGGYPNPKSDRLQGEFTSLKAEAARLGFNTDNYPTMTISAIVDVDNYHVAPTMELVFVDPLRTTALSVPNDGVGERGSVSCLLRNLALCFDWVLGDLYGIRVTFEM